MARHARIWNLHRPHRLGLQRRAIAGICVTWCAVLLLAAAPSNAADLSTATDDPIVVQSDERSITSETTQVTFPLTIAAEASTENITATVDSIARGTEMLDSAALTAEIDAGARILTLTIKDPRVFEVAGDYTVTLSIDTPQTADTATTTDPESAAGPIAEPIAQSIEVTLTRAAAALTADPSVKIADYVELPSWRTPDVWKWLRPWEHRTEDDAGEGGWIDQLYPDVTPPLMLTVSQGELITLSAVQKELEVGTVTLSVDCAAAGKSTRHDTEDKRERTCLLAPGTPVDLPTPLTPDSVLGIDYSLDGFPLGKTVRHVTLTSPQLGAPVSVEFTVTKALTPLAIPLIAIFALFVGWLTKTILPKITKWSQRRRLRRELIAIAGNIRHRYASPPPDDDPLTPYDGDRALARALTGIENALANTNLTQAQIDSQQVVLADALKAANERLATQLKAITDNEAQFTGRQWVLPPTLEKQLEQARAAVERAFTAVEMNQLSAAGIRNAEAAKELDEVARYSREWVERYVTALAAVEEQFAATPVEAAPDLSSLTDRLAEAKAPNPTTIADAREGLTQVSDRMQTWNTALLDRLAIIIDNIARYAGASPATSRDALRNPDPIDALGALNQPLGELIEAAKAAKAREDSDSTSGNLETIPAGPVDDGSAESQTPAGAAREYLATSGAVGGLSLVFSPADAVVAGIGAWAKLLRYAILAVIASLVAMIVSAGDWFGTPDQVLIVFAWAFGLDLVTGDGTGALWGPNAKLPQLSVAESS
jgi:hypothetical protein